MVFEFNTYAQEMKPLISRDFTSFNQNSHFCIIDMINQIIWMSGELMEEHTYESDFDFTPIGLAIKKALKQGLSIPALYTNRHHKA